MGIGKCRITYRGLVDALELPEGTRILNVVPADAERDTVMVVVEHAAIPESETPVELQPTITQCWDRQTRVFDWGLPWQSEVEKKAHWERRIQEITKHLREQWGLD